MSCSAQKSVAGLKSRHNRLHNCTPKGLTGIHSLSNDQFVASGRRRNITTAARRFSPEPLKFRGRRRGQGSLRRFWRHLHHLFIPALEDLWHNGPIRGESCKQCRTRTEEVVAMAIRPSSRPCPMSVSLRIFDVISFRGSGAPEYLFVCRNSADESDGRILNLSYAGAAAALMEFAF